MRRAAATVLFLALAGCAHVGHDVVTSADQAIEIAIRKCGADMADVHGTPYPLPEKALWSAQVSDGIWKAAYFKKMDFAGKSTLSVSVAISARDGTAGQCENTLTLSEVEDLSHHRW